MPWHLLSGRAVSVDLPSECSVYLTDAECQGKCLLDDACHGICLPNEECYGICLLNAVRILWTQNVKGNIDRTTCATASTFWTWSVRVFAFWTQCVYYRYIVSRQMSSRQWVLGHLPSECSVYLTDAECQGKFL